MPTPYAPRIVLPQQARYELQTLVQAHSTPQSLALRARIVLRAGAVQTPNNVQIAEALGCSNRTVGKWRQRYHDLGFLGLQDASRSGRPRTILSPTRVRVLSVASELPQAGPVVIFKRAVQFSQVEFNNVRKRIANDISFATGLCNT